MSRGAAFNRLEHQPTEKWMAQKLDFPSVQLNFSEPVTETGSSEPLAPPAQFISPRSENSFGPVSHEP